ncbi:lanthionine synthetase C family protein [Embleya sp. NPDC020630]|uniref:lanthionine synthetase C family protein n=1 Tax=Embleya sp. NPDC020630 TaxID=3363979 RepID=UPI0037B6CB62
MSTPITALARAAAARVAQHLAEPTREEEGREQSLAQGSVGIALLHIVRARAAVGDWATAHAWLRVAAGTPTSAADDAGLFFGAPALAFAFHTAAGDTDRYRLALSDLDGHVDALAHRRVDLAHARINRRDLPSLAEFDLIYGLTGIGAHLLRRSPTGDALGRVLAYLVRLTEPVHDGDRSRPGWWTHHDPSFRTSPGFVGGHANHGMAHGIAGPLALLSLAQRHGVRVDGQADAIETITAWLDSCRQEDAHGTWWPQWITRDELHTGHTTQPGPLRPSWCYGTPGIARALQLAALATGDADRRAIAEHALLACLSDPIQMARITEAGLCHGWAGVAQTLHRTAQDADTPALAARWRHLIDSMPCAGDLSTAGGLLEGPAGTALALHTAAHPASPDTGWDACLLIT